MPLFVLGGLTDACALNEVLVFTEDGDILGSSVKVLCLDLQNMEGK